MSDIVTPARPSHGGSYPGLRKPLSKAKQRFYKRKTASLIKNRNALDRKIVFAITTVKSHLRGKLSQDNEDLKKREIRHLEIRTKKLAKLASLCRRDPSSRRSHDYDLIRKLLSRFRKHLGPLLMEYTNQGNDTCKENNKTISSGANSHAESESGGSEITESKDEDPNQQAVAVEPSSLIQTDSLIQLQLLAEYNAATGGPAEDVPGCVMESFGEASSERSSTQRDKDTKNLPKKGEGVSAQEHQTNGN